VSQLTFLNVTVLADIFDGLRRLRWSSWGLSAVDNPTYVSDPTKNPT
jgi:hypothetical protein